MNLTDMIARALDTDVAGLASSYERGEPGDTRYLMGESFASRYVVGGVCPSRIFNGTDLDAHIVIGSILALVGDCLIAGKRLETVGYWIDEGRTYFDAGDTWDDLETALKIARQRGELAIWDRVEGKEVRVTY